MTDERTEAELKATVPADDDGSNEDLGDALFEWMVVHQKDLAKREGRMTHSPRRGLSTSPEVLALTGAAVIYSKAFLETLAKHHADRLVDLVRTTRFRFRNNDKNTEAEIGFDGDAAATIVVNEDTPDEARLALLDLDVTAEELRGKVLRWDSSASAWRPADES
jgi:hypothetical protein